jgi:hypothetical protein
VTIKRRVSAGEDPSRAQLPPRVRTSYCRAAGVAALAAALATLVASPGPVQALAALHSSSRPNVAIRIQTGPSQAVIPQSFLGLSWETTSLAYPSLVSTQLANLMRGLGPGLLRVSGVSVDRTRWGIPGAQTTPWELATIAPPVLERLGTLMRETRWGLLLGLDLGHVETPALVQEASTASALLGSSLAAIQIGNEPDLYTHAPSPAFRVLLGFERLREPPWGVQQYEAEITSLRAALAAAGATPPLYGPDTAGPAWLASYAQAEGRGLASLAAHYYPLDRCSGGRLLVHGATLKSLLGARVARNEQRALRALVRLAAANSLPLRIDEANSVACAGQPSVSDTFGAALWALDFSLLAAREGVSGINFHGGLGQCGAGGIVAPWYSPLCALPDGQLRPRPAYYALLALRSLEGCAFVPVTSNAPPNIAVFALRAPDGSLRAVIDHMELATRGTRRRKVPPASPVTVSVAAPASYAQASVVRLAAPSASSLGGATFGGAIVAPDGSFPGAVSAPVASAHGAFAVHVRPASAVILTLSATR